MGLQEKMVIADWYSEIPSSVYLANRKWVKREKAERTSPTKPTHFNFDLNTIFPSPFIDTHFIKNPKQNLKSSQSLSSFSSLSLSLKLSLKCQQWAPKTKEKHRKGEILVEK